MATINDIGGLLSQIATYGSPAEVEALRGASRATRANIPVQRVNENEGKQARNIHASMDKETYAGKKKNQFLRDELTENSVFRILWRDSKGHCRYWNNMSKADQKEYQEMFGFTTTPDFLYHGVPADAFSLKSAQLERREKDVVRNDLFERLLIAVEKKWASYGPWTIAVADISTWPDFIRTHHAAQFIMLKLRPTHNQKVFLIRSRPDQLTKLLKIF